MRAAITADKLRLDFSNPAEPRWRKLLVEYGDINFSNSGSTNQVLSLGSGNTLTWVNAQTSGDVLPTAYRPRTGNNGISLASATYGQWNGNFPTFNSVGGGTGRTLNRSDAVSLTDGAHNSVTNNRWTYFTESSLFGVTRRPAGAPTTSANSWESYLPNTNSGGRLTWNLSLSSADYATLVTQMNDTADGHRYIVAWNNPNDWCVWHFDNAADSVLGQWTGGYVYSDTSLGNWQDYIVAYAGSPKASLAWGFYYNDTSSSAPLGTNTPLALADASDDLRLGYIDASTHIWTKHAPDIFNEGSEGTATLSTADWILVADHSASTDSYPTARYQLDDVATALEARFQGTIPVPYVPNFNDTSGIWPSGVQSYRSINRTAATTNTGDSDVDSILTSNNWARWGTGNALSAYTTATSWYDIITGANNLRFAINTGGTLAQRNSIVTNMNSDTNTNRYLTAYINSENWCVWHFTGTDNPFEALGNGSVLSTANTNFNQYIVASAGEMPASSSVAWAFWTGLSSENPFRDATPEDNLVLDFRNGLIRDWRKQLISADLLDYTGTASATDAASNYIRIGTNGELELSTGGGVNVVQSTSGDALVGDTLAQNEFVNLVSGSVNTSERITTFTNTTAGIVSHAGINAQPNWTVIRAATTAKTDHLNLDTDGNIVDQDRNYSLSQAGSVITTLPLSWETFAFAPGSQVADDEIRVRADSGTLNASIRTAMETANSFNRSVDFIAITDYDNWAIIRYNQVDPGLVFDVQSNGNLLIAGGHPLNGPTTGSIVNYKGSPGTSVQFVFPYNTSGTQLASITQVTNRQNFFLNAGGTFTENDTVDLSDPKAAIEAIDAIAADNVYYDSDDNASRVIKSYDHSSYSIPYTILFNRNLTGDVTSVGYYHGNFGETETLPAAALIATKTITRDSSDRVTGITYS